MGFLISDINAYCGGRRVTRLRAGPSGVELPVGVRDFSFSKAFTSALVSAQLPFQSALGLFPWG
jgi:hypothetical protein